MCSAFVAYIFFMLVASCGSLRLLDARLSKISVQGRPGGKPHLACYKSDIRERTPTSSVIPWKKLKLLTSASIAFLLVTTSDTSVYADSNLGASDTSNTKIQKGGASTLQAGIAKTITRGVNLDGSDFSDQNLKGVAFQQSIVRDSSFKNSNLYSASFFDATLDGSDFENADMTLANVELAQFNRANLKNTIAREMYVVGATNFEGVKSIENSDCSDTDLSKAQRKYLCGLDTAKGTNSKTGVDTRDSLLCE